MSAAALDPRMPMPRWWLALALLAWGALADAFSGAVIMALMLEAIAWSPVRWSMRDRDFHRAADLTSVIFALVAILEFQRHSVHGIYEILRVAPYCFFPLMLAQRASTRQCIPMSALFYSLRRHPRADRPLDVAPHYMAVCILAASTTVARTPWFAAVAVALIGGLLLRARPQRYRWWQWAAALALALALAAGTQAGMVGLRHAVEASFLYWINQFPWSSSDPNRAVTAIGSIGRLKLSDQIRVRVTPSARLEIPLLLQEATYDTFEYGTWSADHADFDAIDTMLGRARWRIAQGSSASGAPIEITFEHRRELTLLPLPRGARVVDSDEIAELQRNRLGSVMAEAPRGALRYTARTGADPDPEPPPTAVDTEVPDGYAGVITRVAREIGVTGRDPARDAERIRDFFLQNFTYSLVQRGGFGRRTPLADFLTRSRRGHCEYFATATVLLLRQAGIPARYAVGYVVEEHSMLENAYIARARHAHSWALAHIDGRWITVDSTPSVWYPLEQAHASSWQHLHDLGSWLWYRYQRVSQADLGDAAEHLLWLVPPLAIVLYLRLRRSPTAVRRDAPARRRTPQIDAPSALDALLEQLGERGLRPGPGETMSRFLGRAASRERNGVLIDDIVGDYYRLRYSPVAHGADAAQALRRKVRSYVSGA